jgi:hypothetical protein
MTRWKIGREQRTRGWAALLCMFSRLDYWQLRHHDLATSKLDRVSISCDSRINVAEFGEEILGGKLQISGRIVCKFGTTEIRHICKNIKHERYCRLNGYVNRCGKK